MRDDDDDDDEGRRKKRKTDAESILLEFKRDDTFVITEEERERERERERESLYTQSNNLHSLDE